MNAGKVFLELLNGFGVSLVIFVGTLLLALPLGLVLCFGARSKFKPLSYLVKGFIWIIRGTPLMLQLMIIFFVPPLVGINLDVLFNWMIVGLPNPTLWLRVIYTIIAFTINYACYFAEIYRGGIDSISKGQYEAARLLGLNRRQTFFKVVFPQVYKRIIPPMGNEIITLVKDTSLARVIAVTEIIMVANNIVSKEGVIWPLFASGIFYLVFNGILSFVFNKLEKKVNYYS